MIGNDVVDLALAKTESNWQRKGFLEKLFTASERQIINQSENPEIMVWNLWSRKEAAYKIYNRETGLRRFMPLQLECIYETAVVGKVVCGESSYFTRTKIYEDCIETIAVKDKSTFSKIQTLNNRNNIYKRNGIPFYNANPVSISRHGRFERLITL